MNNTKVTELTANITELKKVLKTLPEIAQTAVKAQIKQFELEIVELTKYEKALAIFQELTANTTIKYSKRDAVAIALIMAGTANITAKDIKAVLEQAGENVSDTGNQYTQGLPQLLNTAKALNVKLEFTASKLETVENNK
jgi:hypothetical protein